MPGLPLIPNMLEKRLASTEKHVLRLLENDLAETSKLEMQGDKPCVTKTTKGNKKALQRAS